MVRDDQPDAREGQAGRPGESERFIVPRKPGNSGGGKGPQFKTNAIRSEGPGDWATYQLRMVLRTSAKMLREGRRFTEGIQKRIDRALAASRKSGVFEARRIAANITKLPELIR